MHKGNTRYHPTVEECEAIRRYKQFRASGEVKRFHTVRMLRGQTVGAHSHNVAVIAMLVEPNCSATLLKAALTHDFHEVETGDIPSTAKWKYQELSITLDMAEKDWEEANGVRWKLDEHEQAVLRFADLLELLAFSVEDFRMGNHYAIPIVHNVVRVLDGLVMPTMAALALYGELRQTIVALGAEPPSDAPRISFVTE